MSRSWAGWWSSITTEHRWELRVAWEYRTAPVVWLDVVLLRTAAIHTLYAYKLEAQMPTELGSSTPRQRGSAIEWI